MAKAVMLDAKLVIMDEPTAALGVSQPNWCLTSSPGWPSTASGPCHLAQPDDVFQVADRIAVLYLGRLVVGGAGL